jgi:glycosyltransferase involved in cell wall biosynthesis
MACFPSIGNQLTQLSPAANPSLVLCFVSSQQILLTIYALLGPVVWGLYGYAMIAGRRRMLLMRRPPDLVLNDPPLATIVIPAKDEGLRIRNCLESALGQDYANFQVLAIDDRSTDQTGAVMDEVAASNPRLVVLHKTEVPPVGWTGKNHALWAGQQKAGGAWMLFVDSDVVLEKDALSAAMSVVLRKEFDMLSLLPRLESLSIWESMLVPLAGAAASTMYVIALTNNSQLPKCAFANGQFLLISRKAYDTFGGHETVRDRFCEDIEIAVQLKKHGLRPRISWGNDFASVRMYSSLGAIFRGWSRIFYAAKVGSPWEILAASAFLIFCCFTAFPAFASGLWHLAHPTGGTLVWRDFGWIIASIAHLAIMGHFLGLVYRWSGNRRWNALLFPIAGPMLFVILLKALRMCITRKVEWRGTAYSHTMAQNVGTATSS